MQPGPVQSADAQFFVPIATAYAAVCLSWLGVRCVAGDRWLTEPRTTTGHKWLDLAMIPLVIAGVFLIGAAYRLDWLLPELPGVWSNLSGAANLCLPFAPIFVVLLCRRQPLTTVWLSAGSIHWKIVAGTIAAAVGLTVFLMLRGELQRFPIILNQLLVARTWVHAPAVFLEAVAVAFVFVRLRWVAGPVLALLIPCLLFAAAHVPGQIESGRSVGEILAFFVFNTALSIFIFSVVVRSRDVIWIAIPHLVLDIAIGALG